MTFRQMCAIEPQLQELHALARAVKDDGKAPSFCANAVWYGELKPALVGLVGWEARRPELRTEEAYDLAYNRIYSALPPCRGCNCL